VLKCLLRYVSGTTNCGIVYKPNDRETVDIYTDADYAGCRRTGKSTTGMVTMFSGGAINWASQLQPVVATSTTVAEIVAASEGAREAEWIWQLLDSLTKMTGKPTIWVDNEAAVKLAHNPEHHKRTKHLAVKYFYIRDLVTNGFVSVSSVRTGDQLADGLTKALGSVQVEQMRRRFGMTAI
jgi:hypothetical protein